MRLSKSLESDKDTKAYVFKLKQLIDYEQKPRVYIER